MAKTLQLLESESRAKNRQKELAGNVENEGTKEGENFTLKNLLDNMNKMATLEASQTPKDTQKVRQELKQTTSAYPKYSYNFTIVLR